MGVAWGLVGLLFEICIVDASIYSTRQMIWPSGMGWCGVVLLEQFSKLCVLTCVVCGVCMSL